jgi:ubiquinol-cytochrome c reductase cytochrome b subunit
MRFLKRAYDWLDDRLGISSGIMPVIKHPVPRSVNWWYVFGSATLVAFVVQVVTGVALAFTYVPAPNSAYDSLQFITHGAILGNVVRGIHYFGASAMVILIVVHMARAFLFGSYKYPRELNWLTGVVLLLLTLGMAFTGQLLRWEQNAYWSVVVAAAQASRAPLVGDALVRIIAAGNTIGGATLTRFYATHVFLIPALMFGLIGLHLMLVVRHGISEPPRPDHPVNPATYKQEYEDLLHRTGVPFWPDSAYRDVIFALAVGAIVVALAFLVGPPELGAQADPTIIQAYPRPDWYFLWYFALLALLPSSIEDWVIIGFPLLVGIVLLALPFIAPAGERSARRRPWAVAAVGLPVIAIASPAFPTGPVPALSAGLTGSALRGATLFQEKGCIACHTIAGHGGARGPNLTTVGSRRSRDDLIWRIAYGGNNMPAFGDSLQPDELTSLVDYLETRTGG